MTTDGYAKVRERSDAVVAALQEVAMLIGSASGAATPSEDRAHAPGLGLESLAEDLRTAARDTRQGIFKLLVMGEFKHGKSTLLNAVLGRKLLAAKTLPCTAVITLLVSGERQEVAIYEQGRPQPRLVSWEKFVQEFQIGEEDLESLEGRQSLDRFQHVDRAEIATQHPLCRNGVCLIDSPGLKEHASRTRVTFRYLRQSHAVIFVLNALQLLSQDEREFIATHFPPGKLTNVFFVVTRIDMVDNPHEVPAIQSTVKRFLRERFTDEDGRFDEELYQRRTFFVNGRGALEARLAQPPDEKRLQESGVPRLEQELEAFLTSDEKIRAALGGPLRLLQVAAEECQRAIGDRLLALVRPLGDLERDAAAAAAQLAQLEVRRRNIELTIRRFGDNIKHTVHSSLRQYVGEMRDTWPQYARESLNLEEMTLWELVKSAASEESKAKLTKMLEREARRYLELRLAEWARRMPLVIEVDLERMSKEIQAQVSAFNEALDRVRNLFTANPEAPGGGGDANRTARLIQVILGMTDASQLSSSILDKTNWKGAFGQLLQQILIFILVGSLSGGAGLIVLVISEVLFASYQTNKALERVSEELGSRLHEGLAEQIQKQQQTLHAAIEQQFSELAEQVNRRLQGQIREVRLEQERILESKRSAEFSLEQEQKRLQTIGQRVRTLATTVESVASGQALSSAA